MVIPFTHLPLSDQRGGSDLEGRGWDHALVVDAGAIGAAQVHEHVRRVPGPHLRCHRHLLVTQAPAEVVAIIFLQRHYVIEQIYSTQPYGAAMVCFKVHYSSYRSARVAHQQGGPSSGEEDEETRAWGATAWRAMSPRAMRKICPVTSSATRSDCPVP